MRLALLATALLLVALAIESAPLGRMVPRAPAVARTIPPVLSTPRLSAPRALPAPSDAPVDPLAALPPEDADWVLDHVERAESVRVLDDAQRARLIAQLVSVRMHDIVERTEVMP